MQNVEISPGEKKFARDDVRLDHLGVDVLPVDHLHNLFLSIGTSLARNNLLEIFEQ